MNRHRFLLPMLAIALVLFAYRYWTSRPEPAAAVLPAATGEQLDYRFADLVYREYDAAGTPRLTLWAPQMHHDPQGEVIEVQQPEVEFHHRDMDWRIKARYGRLDRTTDLLALREQVRIDGRGRGEPLAVDCDSLDYNLTDATVQTASRIKLARGAVDLSGDGLSGNLVTGHYRLHQNVEIRLDAPPAIN